MVRRFLLICSGFSLLLCAATVALWVRSYWLVYDVSLEKSNVGQQWSLGSDGGQIRITRICRRESNDEPLRWQSRNYTRENELFNFGMVCAQPVGAFALQLTVDNGWRERDIVFPDWALVLTLLTLSIALRFQSKLARGRERRGKGLCTGCGYDLRASSERCPECGRMISNRSSLSTRIAFWLSTGFEILLCCAILGATWWIDPWRGASRTLGQLPDYGMDFYPIWEPNRGTGDERMHRVDKDWGQAWDQALIHQPDGDRLLVSYWGHKPNE